MRDFLFKKVTRLLLRTIKVFGVLASLFFLFSCSTSDKNSDTPEGSFAIAEEYDKDERFDIAIQKYQDVKNKFPYSQFATRAELAIADVYYKQESFAEAQVSYQAFRDLHPKHTQIDYVIYKIAMSFYQQVPEAIDRDLSLAHDAITNFHELVEKYPASKHVKECQEKHLELLKKLAQKEEYIADFYMKREKWDSAVTRYENLLSKYPHQGYDEKALSKAAICSFKNGEASKAQKFLIRLQTEYPNSAELEPAKKVVK